MKLLRIVPVFCLLLCVVAPARADEASKREKIHEMFGVLHMDRNVQQMMDGMMKQVSGMSQQMTGDTKMPPEVQAKMDDFQKRVFALVTAQVSWDKLEPEYTELYAQTYTEQEVDGILAFYHSPSGEAMIAKTPELLSKSMALSQQRMQAVMPQLMQMVQDFAKEVRPAAAAATHPAK